MAYENTDFITQRCFRSSPPFRMKISDIYQNEVMNFRRPYACWLNSVEISAAADQVFGRIEQEWTMLYPSYTVKNHNNETVLRIEGPLCAAAIFGDVEFRVMITNSGVYATFLRLHFEYSLKRSPEFVCPQILSLDGIQVGSIFKQTSGLAKELFTDYDYFGVKFPMNLDVRMKAVMLGACFLIVIPILINLFMKK